MLPSYEIDLVLDIYSQLTSFKKAIQHCANKYNQEYSRTTVDTVNEEVGF